MELSNLFHGVDIEILQGDETISVENIQYDSRKIGNGDVFFCISGFQTDGHQYAMQAVEKGALALVCQKPLQGISKEICIIQVKNTRSALALASANYYGRPSLNMQIVGVTGTNGKTSTTYLIKSILDGIGRKVGIIGTIENRIGDKVIPTERTTPESLELQALLQTMDNENVTDVLMEVSSHSLDLHRVDGISYDIAIFTNLSQDHLDYHKTMENYKLAKSLLFQRSETSIINVDDPAGEFMLQKAKGKVISFAIDKKADLQAKDIEISSDGVKFSLLCDVGEFAVKLHTPGRFSIYNALGAIAACQHMGVSIEAIINGLYENFGVLGRFQRIKSKRGFNAIVDYAHTPDGLENILKTAKEFVEGDIITIFGCGGDRDRSKRPIMGEIAGRLSNYCIITSDNPRTEDPMAILEDVEIGVKKSNCSYTKRLDRREAIAYGVSMAKSGDLLIVAGKGHENYQIFHDKTIHFDDIEELMKAFGED